MNIENVLTEVVVVAALTGMATEAIKKILAEFNKTYHSNTLAGIVSVILSVAIGAGNITVSQAIWDRAAVCHIICLVFASWLCAMVGYDKVVQTLKQINK